MLLFLIEEFYTVFDELLATSTVNLCEFYQG